MAKAPLLRWRGCCGRIDQRQLAAAGFGRAHRLKIAAQLHASPVIGCCRNEQDRSGRDNFAERPRQPDAARRDMPAGNKTIWVLRCLALLEAHSRAIVEHEAVHLAVGGMREPLDPAPRFQVTRRQRATRVVGPVVGRGPAGRNMSLTVAPLASLVTERAWTIATPVARNPCTVTRSPGLMAWTSSPERRGAR